MTSALRLNLLLCVVLVATTCAVYWSGMHGGFLFDDFPNIVTNLRVQPKSLTWEALQIAARAYEPGEYGRPLATISFALDFLISGKNAWAFKLTSLGVHLLNALLVFWLLRRLLALPRAAGQATWTATAAFAIALLWAVHPLQVSAVLYIVQRMETLATTFVLLALIAYLRGRVAQQEGRRGWPWLCGAIVLAGTGMLSKENAVLVPAYTLTLEVTVLGFQASSPRTRKMLQVAYATGVIASLLLFVFWVLPHYAGPASYAERNFDMHDRLLTQLRVLPLYLGQMVLPLPGTLTFYYDTFVKSTGWLSPATTLAGGLLLLGMFLAAWRLRDRLPLVSLGIFWFFAAHLLTSNVFNLELVFEHRNYFALLGILLGGADLVRHFPMRDGPALKYAAVAAVILGFGLLSTVRSATWGNPLLLATDLVAKNPQSGRASNDLATLYVGLSGSDPDSFLFDLGRKEFERGSRLPNASPLPEQGLILMAATTGLPVKDEWWKQLIHKLSTRPISPEETATVTGLLQQRYDGIELDDRRLSQAYQVMLARSSQPAHIYALFGDYALTYLRDEELADRMFVAAVERNPADTEYANRVLANLIADGHLRQARLVQARGKQLGLYEHEDVVGPDQ